MNLTNIFSHRNRALLRELVATEFKLRYQGSVLGYLWSLFRPLFLFGILYLVFGYFAKFGGDVPHYPIYLLLGIILWNFFVETTNFGLQSIVGRGDLIRKIHFPKYIIVVSGSISALINLGISLIVFFCFLLLSDIALRPAAMLLPLLILELYIFALALSFFLSALYVKYRDISYIWELLMQAGIYATPIIYPFALVIQKSHLAAKLMLFNPVAQIIQDARYILVTTKTDTLLGLSHSWLYFSVPIFIVIIMIASASIYFRNNSKYFAEEV